MSLKEDASPLHYDLPHVGIVADESQTYRAVGNEDGALPEYEMASNGIERAVSAFGIYNGLRIVNLAQKSRFRDFFHTQTIDSLVEEMKEMYS